MSRVIVFKTELISISKHLFGKQNYASVITQLLSDHFSNLKFDIEATLRALYVGSTSKLS